MNPHCLNRTLQAPRTGQFRAAIHTRKQVAPIHRAAERVPSRRTTAGMSGCLGSSSIGPVSGETGRVRDVRLAS